MKKYSFLYLLMLLSIIGCADLEEEQLSVVDEEFIFADSTVEDVDGFVETALSHMHHRNFLSREMAQALMFRSDMMAIGRTGVQERIDHDNFTVLSDNGLIRVYWPKVYEIISASNTAIKLSGSVAASTSLNQSVAKARFIRAFAYFHLVRQFGAIPYIDENTTAIEIANNTRMPVEDVYANIIADLEYAKEWLPNTQATRAIPAKSAASSYLALVYLTMEEWQKAYDEAKEVIDNEGTYNLGLEPDFQNLYHGTNIDASLEPIFVLDFTGVSNGDQGRDYQAAFTSGRGDDQHGIGGGWSVQVPALEVYTEWDSADYRRAVTFDDTMYDITTDDSGVVTSSEVFDYTIFTSLDDRSVNRPHVRKYSYMAGTGVTAPQDNNGRGSHSNYCMMRYAEVLMIGAEAANEIGNTSDAESWLNRVLARARSGGVTNGFTASASPADVSGLSQADFTDRILEERRLEFAYEFKRWYDIARRKLGDSAFSSVTGLERVVSTEVGVGPGVKSFDPAKDYLLPIPQGEIDLNPNLLPNNPGY